MATSNKWRLYITAVEGTGNPTVAELEMFSAFGGASVCTGGTALASSNTSGNAAANAFDGNIGTTWVASAVAPGWVEYDFPSPVTIVGIGVRTLSGNSPKDFKFEYYDGAAWLPLLTVSGEIGWVSNERRTYYAYPATAWRLYVTQTDNSYFTIAEVGLRPVAGGANVSTTGRISASSTYSSSYDPSYAFDGNTSTAYGSLAGMPQWLRREMSGGQTSIVEYTLRAATFPAEMPRTFKLQYNDGAGGWVDADTRTSIAAWASGEVRTFTVANPYTGSTGIPTTPPAGAGRRPQVFVCT